MDYGAIATLIACGATVLVNIIILCVNLHVQTKRDKINGRVFPVVSLWNNKEDHIDNRLKGSKDRIFFDKKNKTNFRTSPYIFFVIRNTSSQNNMTNCNVEICFLGEIDRTEKYRIGAILHGNTIIIPAQIYFSYTSLICKIDYYTDAGETIICTVKANIDFSERTDYFVISKRSPIQYRKQYELNTRLTQSFLAGDFWEKDEKFSFDFNETGEKADAA